jgi:hypothetical protein
MPYAPEGATGIDGWMDGWMDEWMGGWVDGWMDGWRDGQTDRQTDKEFLFSDSVRWFSFKFNFVMLIITKL